MTSRRRNHQGRQADGGNLSGRTLRSRSALTVGRAVDGERAALDYHAALGSGTDYARAFAAAEARLRDLSAREARERWLLRGSASAVLLGSAFAITYNELTATTARERFNGRAFGGVGAMVGASLLEYRYRSNHRPND